MSKTKGYWGRFVSGPERAFLFEALSSEHARSLYIPLIFSAVIFSTGFLFPPATYFGISIHVLDAMTLPASLAVFALGKLLARTKDGLDANLLIWILAGLFSAASPTLILLAVTGQLSSEISAQLPIGMIAYSLLIIVSALISAGWRISRQRMVQLKEHKLLLIEIQDDLELQIDTMKQEIKQGVDQELSKALRALDKGDDPKSLAELLLNAIDEVIRPLSHRLSGLGLKSFPPKTMQAQSGIDLVIKGVPLALLAAPDIYIAMFAVFILPAAIFTEGISGLLFALIFLALEVALLVTVERFAKNLVLNRILGIFALAFFSGIVGLGYSFVMSSGSISGISVGFVTISLATTGVMALVSKRLDDLRKLADVNRAMQEVIAVLRQEAWVTKNQLAKAIHGSVQAKFLSVALRLANSPKISKGELAAARKDLEVSLDEVAISMKGKASSFAAQLKTITEAWEGVAKLRVKADKGTIALINRFPLARTCVMEVIGEAVANAAKHSKAPSMDIELQENDQKEVVVSVWSAGRLADQSGRKGYGSQMLNEVTTSWSLTNLQGRVYLRAVVPLAK